MSKVTGKDTTPEIIVRRYLFSLGFRFRKNVSELPGKPDIVLPKYKTVVFVNGCFWHGHRNCKKASLPRSNRDFWEQKILRNTSRDRAQKRALKKMGYRVLVVWQCELRPAFRDKNLEKLVKKVRADAPS